MASVTKHLQVGQKVSVSELETGCHLTVVDAAAPGLTIVENVPEYVVLEDAAGEVKTRIPSYLVRTVTGLPEVAEPEPAEPVVEVPLIEAVVETVVEPVLPPLEMEPTVEMPVVVVTEAA